MIWVFIGVIVLIVYGVLYFVRVSKGLHFWGKPITQDKFQSTKIQYAMIFIFLIVLTFVVPFKMPEKKEDPNTWKKQDNSIMAYVMMQDFVKRRLVSPNSAKFPYTNDADVTIEKDGYEYVIFSYVDSQNGFGAMLRTYYSGVVKQIDDKKWELVILDIGDE
jgi:uncharacterized membrane protein